MTRWTVPMYVYIVLDMDMRRGWSVRNGVEKSFSCPHIKWREDLPVWTDSAEILGILEMKVIRPRIDRADIVLTFI